MTVFTGVIFVHLCIVCDQVHTCIKETLNRDIEEKCEMCVFFAYFPRCSSLPAQGVNMLLLQLPNKPLCTQTHKMMKMIWVYSTNKAKKKNNWLSYLSKICCEILKKLSISDILHSCGLRLNTKPGPPSFSVIKYQ